MPAEIASELVPKGSVTVDGISLTVVDVLTDGFTLVIIPHTARETTIDSKGPGSEVNIETDIIGKYVYRFLRKQKGGESDLLNALKSSGFIGA